MNEEQHQVKDGMQERKTLRTATIGLLDSLHATAQVKDKASTLRQRLAREEQSELEALAQISSDVSHLAETALEIERNAFSRTLKKLEQGVLSQQQHVIQYRDQAAQQADTVEQSSNQIGQQLDEVSLLIKQQDESVISDTLSPAISQLSSQFSDLSSSVIGGLQALQNSFETLETKLEEIESQAAMYRQKAEYFSKLSRIDPLTQLANRTGFDEQAKLEVQRWRRYQVPLTLAIVDLDHFKLVNDRYGHLVGDQVLRAVAMQLNKSLRDADFVARFGGEEFVILLPHTELEPAVVVMDRMRAAIAALPFRLKGQNFNVTASIGVSQLQGSDELEALLENADNALLRAKREGRNRCEYNGTNIPVTEQVC